MIYRPPFIKQLDGSTFAGSNCTIASTCMAVARHFRGVNPAGSAPWYPRPSIARGWTGDRSGGTNLAQNEAWAIKYYHADLLVSHGGTWATFVSYVKAGRGAVLQGLYFVFHGTAFNAGGTFAGNHAVYINEIRYNATLKRNEFLMYDPLADGRRFGIYKGPRWISEALLKKFAGNLILNPRTDQKLGFGKTYAMFTRDTEAAPVLRLNTKWHATAYAKTVYSKINGARVRVEPTTAATVSRTLSFNAPFVVRQKTIVGQAVNGNRTWYGDLSGTRWVHSSVVKLTT